MDLQSSLWRGATELPPQRLERTGFEPASPKEAQGSIVPPIHEK